MAINRVVERQSAVSSAIITAEYDACTPAVILKNSLM